MSRTTSYCCGLLFRLSSLWIGVHYSSFDRRFCINLLPCLTFWIALPGGHIPREVRSSFNYYAGFVFLPPLFVIRLLKNVFRMNAQAWRWTVGDMQRAVEAHRRSFGR